jgi:hypothetical protein
LDVFQLAEEYFLITISVVTGIGALQGAILGRGIRNRFPSLKHHARTVSCILLVLFSISAIGNVINFASPPKASLDAFTMHTLEDLLSVVANLLGINAGIGMAIATFVSLALLLIFRFADVNVVAKYFMFVLSVMVVLAMLVARFTDYVPTQFQIILYAFYEVGVTVGIFLVTSRKSEEIVSEIDQ